MSMYDSGYKDGANAGYKLAIDDILEKLNYFGFKHNIKFHRPKDSIDDIITLIKYSIESQAEELEKEYESRKINTSIQGYQPIKTSHKPVKNPPRKP